MKLDFGKAVHSIVSDDIMERLKEYEDVIVFGAGQSGDWVVKLLRINGIFPKLYCDNSARKWGGYRNHLKIESFENAMSLYPNAAICIGSMWVEEILKQIKGYNQEIMNRTWDMLPTMAWETSDMLHESSEKEYIFGNLGKFQQIYAGLADIESQKTLEGLLNYRLTRDKTYLKEIKSEETPYLDSTIFSREMFSKICEGALIDGGAFDGDTVELFIHSLGEMMNLDIHCYEPGMDNCKKIEEKLQSWEPHRITLHKTALWCNSDSEISFVEDGLAGKVEENENTVITDAIKTEHIDGYPYKNVGLIKLDIEGAERSALEGARVTIERCRPILAICAYHLQDDIPVLWDFVKSLKIQYKVLLRHYMCSSGDTILYAIPEA